MMTLNAASSGGSLSLTFPTGNGSSGQFLQTNGSGVLSWGTVSSGASSLNDLSNVLIETNSLYIGHDPSSTTNDSHNNVALGTT